MKESRGARGGRRHRPVRSRDARRTAAGRETAGPDHRANASADPAADPGDGAVPLLSPARISRARWSATRHRDLVGGSEDTVDRFPLLDIVAYNENQTVFASKDGIAWQVLPSGPAAMFQPVLQLPDGFASLGLHGEIWHSGDRLVRHKTKIEALTDLLTGIAYGNGALVGIEAGWRGTFGRILPTGALARLPVAISSARLLPDARRRLMATGPSRTEQLVESASELGHWSLSNRLTNVTGIEPSPTAKPFWAKTSSIAP